MIEELYNENLVDSPDDIEQVIEGGAERAYDSERENGDENQKSDEDRNKENVDDKDKKATKVRKKIGPRMVLNAERLNGPRGIGVMESFFSDLKLHGKGHEKDDLEAVMKRMEHWAHRLAPRLQFDDCLKKIEKLGSKKEVANRVKRIRLDLDLDDDVVRDDAAEAAPDSPTPPDDPFDQLIASSVATPLNVDMTTEQREQMLRNRLLAEERRAARIKRAQEMKLKFQEKLLNSETVDSQCVDSTQPADEGETENLSVDAADVSRVLVTVTNTDSVTAGLVTVKEPTEGKGSTKLEFERMLVNVDENQTDYLC